MEDALRQVCEPTVTRFPDKTFRESAEWSLRGAGVRDGLVAHVMSELPVICDGASCCVVPDRATALLDLGKMCRLLWVEWCECLTGRRRKQSFRTLEYELYPDRIIELLVALWLNPKLWYYDLHV